MLASAIIVKYNLKKKINIILNGYQLSMPSNTGTYNNTIPLLSTSSVLIAINFAKEGQFYREHDYFRTIFRRTF